MQPAPWFFASSGHICHLRHAIYGFKQALHAWFEKFHQSLLSVGYTKSFINYVMLYRPSPLGIILLIFYVNDMNIKGSDHDVIASLKQHLKSQFEMKILDFYVIYWTLGLLTLLGVFYSHKRNIFLSFLNVLLSEILLFLILY